MLRAKRFLTEYANSKIMYYNQKALESPENRSAWISRARVCDNAVYNYMYGIITIDEAMRAILES